MAAITSLVPSTQQGYAYGAAFAPPAGAASVQVQAIMNDADVLAAGANQRTMQIYLEASYDNGLSWQSDAWVGWQSGPTDVNDAGAPTPPGVNVPVAHPMPGLYRPSLNAPAPTYVGLTLTFFDAQGNIL